MYEEYYGFVQSPFTLAPDPRFLYLSESHDEAIRLLLQSIRRKEGFIVLAGDIGTGKTTLCRALLQQLDSTTFTSLVLNPFLSVEELLREILLDFGVVSRQAVRSGRLASASKHDLISTLHEFLLSLVPIHGSGVLIIDEAQHLSLEVLEQIRVISNLETNESKLLQIVLVGQLNLLDVLADSQIRQLDQRISLRAMLRPLTPVEVDAYVAHRLSVARGTASVSFDAEALHSVHAYAGGVPRIINLLCDRALTLGAQAGVNTITAGLIDEAAQTLALKRPVVDEPVWYRRLPRWVPTAAGAVAVVALLGLAMPWHRLVNIPMPAVAPPARGPIAPAVQANPIPAEELARQAAPPRRRPILDPVEPYPP